MWQWKWKGPLIFHMSKFNQGDQAKNIYGYQGLRGLPSPGAPESQSWLKSFGRTSCESVTPDVSQSRNQSFERSFRCLDMMMFMVTMVMSRPVVMMVTMMMIYRTMVMMFMVTMMMQRSAVLPHEQVQSGGIRQLQGIVPLCTRDFTPDPSYNYNLDEHFMI